MQIAPTLSRENIRMLTRELRKALGVENDPYFPIMEFVELLMPKLYEDFELQICPVSEMKDIHGLTYPERHIIYLREDIYEGACKGHGRDRFTVAHELGHFLLHSPERMVLAKFRGLGETPTYMNPEWQADAFAGELLVPSYLMSNATAEIIEARCGVSRAAAICQLRKMKKAEGSRQ